jgi:predicted nucleic acid-binding protein
VRVVLHTNVLLSAILFGGIPGQILDAWRAGQVELVMSPDIVDEYVRVGERLNGRYTDVDIQPIVALVVQNATIVPSLSGQS